jgi:putative endopeptidase
MRRISLTVLALLPVLIWAQAPSKKTVAPDTQPLPTLRSVPVFDLSAMDKNVNPCDDFFRYACGGWMAHNPIPSDQGSWGRFNELQERNREVLHAILERDSKPDPARSPVAQKIGDFYAACMDESKANALGAKPIEPELQRIARISTVAQMMNTLAHMHSLGMPALFRFGQTADLHNASMTIAGLDQGGIGLPNKDYYTKTDPKSVETRDRYVDHIQKMLVLLGEAPDKAAAGAKNVMDIELKLANASLDPVSLRKPENRDHPMTKADVDKLAPTFGFAKFFVDAGAPSFEKINVGNPEFFKQANALLTDVPLDQWKTYLRWNLVRATAPYLSEAFVQENFKFNDQYLGGQKELQARWKRCVRLTDQQLGEALGQPYVEETFGVEGKQRTLKMVKAIEEAMGDDLKALPWMTEETKKASAVKLAGVSNKIGYPDQWRDYSKVNVTRGDYIGNVQRSRNFEYTRQLNKIGKPVDKSEWGMTPPTVNAYYNPPQNNINFPAGILQPPFYDNKADDAVNFGGIGAVIGHELTHGFDDQGAKFDAQGNLRNWWTEQDKKEFEQRTGCIADEYSGFVAVDDVHVNGRLTLGENTADNGGVSISLMALHKQLEGKNPGLVDGYTPEQRFYIAFGQIWCQNQTPESARRQALGDPHSPGRYRVNGVVQNMPEFQKAFSCPASAPMVSQNSCHVW